MPPHDQEAACLLRGRISGNLSKSETLSADWPRMNETQRCLVPDPFVAGARRKRQRNQQGEETKVTTCAQTSVRDLWAHADYVTGARDELIAQHPHVAELIREYTR